MKDPHTNLSMMLAARLHMIKILHKQSRNGKDFVFLQALLILKKLPTVIDVDIPADRHITVCGDVHGQYYDLLNIFKLNGLPSPTNPYLFNGMSA